MTDDMPDVARSLDALRTFMTDFTKRLDALAAGDSATAPHEVRASLPVYAQLVPAFDERLARCADLLRQGLRDEAIGYESDAPALVEAVELLDLASRGQAKWEAWKAALGSHGFPLPALPRMDMANALVEAKNTIADLKPLLDRWRRLNLANAPLPERLRMLRKLRQKDPNNAVWFDSIKEYERQRLMVIERDIKAAIAAKDEPALTALVAELDEPWAESPPARLKTAAGGALEGIVGDRWSRQMDEVCRDLAAAFEARDLEAGRQLRKRLAALLGEKSISADAEPRAAAVEPAATWVDRHDRLHTLLLAIPDTLDEEPKRFRDRVRWKQSLQSQQREVEDLAEKLHDEVDAEPIERNLERIARVVEQAEREERNRRRAWFAGLAAAAFLVAGIVIYEQWRASHDRQVRAAVAAIDDCEGRIKAGEEVDPDQVLDRYTVPVKADPRVSGRLVAVRAEKANQDARRARLAATLERIDESIRAVDVARPKRTDPLEPWPVEFAQATRDLAAADGDAVTEAEKRRLQSRRNDVDLAKTKFHTAADAHVEEAIRSIDEQLVALRELVVSDRGAVVKGVDEQSDRLGDLRRRATQQAAPGADGDYADLKTITRSARQPIDEGGPIDQKIKALRDKIGNWEAFATTLKLLDAMVGKWDRYAAQLRDITRDFPSIPEAREYGACVDAEPMWVAADAWSAFAAEVGPVRTPVEAQQVLDGMGKLSEAAGALQPAVDFRKKYGPMLEALANQKPDDLKAAVEKFLDSVWLADIKTVVQTADDPFRYYCLDEPRPGEFPKYITAWKNEVWPLKPLPNAASDVQPAPQVAMRTNLRAGIPKLVPTGPQLDELVVKLLEIAITSKNVDPVLQAVTVRQVFIVGRDHCRGLQCAEATALVGALVDPADTSTITGIPKEALFLWVRPDRDTLAEYRSAAAKARAVLEQAQDTLPAIRRAIEADKALLENPGGERLIVVGRMGRNAAGQPTAVVRGKPEAGDVVTIDAAGAIKPAGAIDAIGRFTAVSPAAPAGTPLWRRIRFGSAAKPSKPADKTPPRENRGP